MDRLSALVYCPTEEGGDYFLNMDNDYILTELKGVKDQGQIDLTQARYTYSMTLIGMSIISHYKNMEHLPEGTDIPSEVKKISSMVSPILIPMFSIFPVSNLT